MPVLFRLKRFHYSVILRSTAVSAHAASDKADIEISMRRPALNSDVIY